MRSSFEVKWILPSIADRGSNLRNRDDGTDFVFVPFRDSFLLFHCVLGNRLKNLRMNLSRIAGLFNGVWLFHDSVDLN